MTDRRFIEESFPVKEVGAESAREKSIRHGHISTLHIWWARRPLASSRATAYAALTPAADDITEWQRQRDFIVELCRWENSLEQALLEKGRQDILQAHAERLSQERGKTVTVADIEAGRAPRPRTLDAFAGGGSIPLEALRLGCETYASDYNPVAVLILKATVEYPQKFARPRTAKVPGDLFGGLIEETLTVNPLLEAVKRWGDWVLEESRKELADFYPPEPGGAMPMGYIWTRTIPCQNPSCGAEIPLMRQFWLAKKSKKRVALHPQVTDGEVVFRIVGDGYGPWPEGFDPSLGTISRAVSTCLACGAVTDAKTTRHLFQDGKARQRMVVVVSRNRDQPGKTYRLATDEDEAVYRKAKHALQEKRQRLMLEWGMDPVPDEPIPSTMPGGLHTPAYGMTTWGAVFNTRQQLALVTFADKVREAYSFMIAEETDPEFAVAVATYLAITFSRLADKNATIVIYNVVGEKIEHVFGRQALPMAWDYVELQPFDNVGWPNMHNWVQLALSHLSQIPSVEPPPQVVQSSASQLSYPDNFFDAVLTDPPYYYSVTYADLSDFFYVWLKRTIGHLHPGLFSTPLTPKQNEIIERSFWDNTSSHDAQWYEDMLRASLKEAWRVLKRNGVALIVYAHKTTSGWETLLNALLDSGLVVSGSWPIHTERQARLMARKSAALASSIYIVARKMARQPAGFYNEIQDELRQHLDRKLHSLWEEGIGGADFFIAAIGSAIEVFGKYEQVIDYEGNVVRADRLLEDVRTMATDYAVRQILQNGFAGEVSDLTRLYVLWRWNYGEVRVPFDEARKLAQSCGVDLEREWGRRGFVRKEKEFVRLIGPQKRKTDELTDSREMIDVLHNVLLLWEKNRSEELIEALAASGYGGSEAFYRVAQAISETLPNDSREKKLLDGFLIGRERVRGEVAQATRQGRLWE